MHEVRYGDKRYPVREVYVQGEEWRVSTTELSEALYDNKTGFRNLAAERLDETIAWYATPEEMTWTDEKLSAHIENCL